MLRETPKAAPPQGKRTEAHVGGGQLRSSAEVAVMAMERREQLIWVKCIEQLINY
jgi:hypothetical protein